MEHTERDVFNNIFVQMTGLPGVNVGRPKVAENLQEGGNLLWGVKDGPAFKGDLFGKLRASPLFKESQKVYEPGWTTQDRLADPKFVGPPVDGTPVTDLRLPPGSPAIGGGVPVPAEWPDPLRTAPPVPSPTSALAFPSAPCRGAWASMGGFHCLGRRIET